MASTSNQNQQATSLGKNNRSSSARSPKSPENNPKSRQSKSSMGLGLILIAISTSLVGLGGLGYFIYQELLSSSKREMDTLAAAKSSQIESKVASIQKSVDTVASRAIALPKSRTAAMYQKLLVESLQSSEPSAAMAISANGNLLAPNSKPFTTYVLKDQSGLNPEPKAQKLPAPNDTLLATTLTDVQKLPWYKPALDGNSVWTDPYDSFGQNIVTYSAAINENNKPVGVVSSDVVVSSLLADAGADKIGFVVVSAGGKLIASSDSFQLAQAQNSAIATSLNTLLQQATSQPSGITQTAGNLWAYRQIAGSNWIVATYVPEQEIISKLVMPLGVVALGLSSILVIAILGFTNSLKKRLQPITEECERFLAQQGNTSVASGKDDIENLSISLKTTLQQVKHNEIRLRNEFTQVSATTDASSSQAQQQMQQSFAENELIEAEVGDLLDVVSSMEEGDLTIEAQVNDRATGLVADTLNRLREKLVEIISSVLGTAQQVAKGASDLEELARTVVLNTAEQAQSVAQGQALTEQVAMIAQRSASQVGVANRSLQEVRETVASGQTAIDTLTDSISVLQSGSAQIVQRIKTLGEFVGLAEQFVQDQGQIASLTQVLALNATLVAARAAEQKDPKQFASVAREFESIAGQVNELATQTNEGLTILQQRTSQIQTVVTAIDSEVQSLSGLVSGFTTGVESSQAAFQNIQTVTEGVVQIGQTITESSTEIAEAAGSTATYISEIAQLAERTAILTRSARQQAEQMGNQAQQLLQGIQFFRLPESSYVLVAATASLPTADVNLAVDEQIVQPDVVKQSFDYQSYSDSNANEGADISLIVVPTLAVAAASTPSVFQQNDLPEAIPSDIAEDSVITDEINDSDDYLLEPDYESLEDLSIDYESNLNADLATQDDQVLSFMDDLEPIDEFGEDSNDLYVLDDPAEIRDIEIEQTSQVQDDAYSGITDITMIEESLFADLKQEVYQDSYDADYYLDDLAEEDTSLKNPLDGVDEMAISEAATDPLILSATDSFMEDTTFGTPSPLSDETLANLPTNVDFNIPDLDGDNDFEISNNMVESTLDESNSFFDSSFTTSSEQIDQVDIESAFGDFAEQDNVEADRYVIDEEMFAPSSAADLEIDISEQLSSPESEDYNNYIEDEALNESLEDTFGESLNTSFDDSFGVSFDESPFDRAFDEAINDYQSDPFGETSENLTNDAVDEIATEYQDVFTEPSQSTPASLDNDSTSNESTAFPSLFDVDMSDDDFDSDYSMGFSEARSDELDEEVEVVDQDLDSIWQSESFDSESFDVAQERSPVDDLVMPDFSITDEDAELADMSDDFEAIAPEDTLTDEMFSFDLREEADPLTDKPFFDMDLGVEVQDDLDQNETANLFDEELPDILENVQEDTTAAQSFEQIEDTPDLANDNDLVVFDQISESQDFDLAADLAGLDALTDELEESAIFEVASGDLDLEPALGLETPENFEQSFEQNIVDELSSLYGIDSLEELENEDTASQPDLEMNWLDETTAASGTDEMFGDLLIDYPSLDQPSLEVSPDYSVGFADELLDSLMSESDPSSDFSLDMSDGLLDLSAESVDTAYTDPFASTIGAAELEDSKFSFDFSDFENLDDEDVQDKPSKELVDARSEIDSFLSETFLDPEEKKSK
ncbi:MAG: hypothetical protein AUK48_15220 [Oscillatoriales cyanobacterium CG2_30_44_21]|nr:MAG: hypothetical protein AUK48_15220 [Oscillatoriales cyanobacterium CG2_30_44_21]